MVLTLKPGLPCSLSSLPISCLTSNHGYDMFALNGVEVQCADGGTQGLAMLAAFQPTLVILDLAMPKPDGWDVLNEIRTAAATAQLPVVAITAYYSDRVADEAEKAGFTALVSKPIKINNFLSTLQEILG
jgi:CheY-like chemotaxis protein